MATTVHIKNISNQTNEAQVRDFFSFCGKISSLTLHQDGAAQSSTVTFEKPTAAKTALLLDNTQLGSNLVNVSSAATLEEMSGTGKSGATPAAQSEKTGGDPSLYTDDVDQEDKPRSRILAEYLAHGYTISDKAIERGIALDNTHGISARFTSALSNFDDRYKASEKAANLDTRYGVSEKAATGWRGMTSYFEKAMGTPTGQRVHQFYTGSSKQVMDVHTEARRLANLKSGKPAYPAPASGSESATMSGAMGGATESVTPVPGTDKTTCGCGGDTGKCPCEAGKCACSSCPKNAEHGGEASAFEKEKAQMESVGDGRTKCNCAGNVGGCPCEPGKCACGTCAKNPDVGK
ncbi:MAG: hypothetical protein M1828_005794 [Chrysothrix sp. TS-e1954]|nr:MAG: hypothetical protein M1828_005794 [Chrysothrix sp. TS-e1954]